MSKEDYTYNGDLRNVAIEMIEDGQLDVAVKERAEALDYVYLDERDQHNLKQIVNLYQKMYLPLLDFERDLMDRMGVDYD